MNALLTVRLNLNAMLLCLNGFRLRSKDCFAWQMSKSYLWLKDFTLDIYNLFIHWTRVDGCFTEALVLQDPETKYKTRDTLSEDP